MTSTDKLSSTDEIPSILSFSAQPAMTKYDICKVFARLGSPSLDTANLVPVDDGPGPGETIRPRDCWMSNVSPSLPPFMTSAALA